MGKHPKRKTGAARMDEPMNGAMKLFLAGCAGEAYLLILRRFYINAHAALQIAWYDRYLWIGMGVGAAVMAAGLWACCAARRIRLGVRSWRFWPGPEGSWRRSAVSSGGTWTRCRC